MKKLTFALSLIFSLHSIAGDQCPSAAQTNLDSAKTLVFVTGDAWDSSRAKLNVYTMGSNGFWQKSTDAQLVNQDAYIGASGFGWGHDYHDQGDQLMKLEGDGKSPAGVFGIGEAFGVAPHNDDTNYTPIMRELKKGETANPKTMRIVDGKKMVPNAAMCPDDVEKPAFYDRIWREDVTKFVSSGELLGENPLYTCGLMVKTGSKVDQLDKDQKPTGTGSCIFVHHFDEVLFASKEKEIKDTCGKLAESDKANCAKQIEAKPEYGGKDHLATSGCTAIHQTNMCKLMDYARKAKGKVAFSALPKSELQKAKWRNCFPGVELDDVKASNPNANKSVPISK